jgi:hypothetical protein
MTITEGQRQARLKETNEYAYKLQTLAGNIIAEYVTRLDCLRTLKLSSGMVEWTEVIGRKEYRCAVYLDTRLEIIHYDDPAPEDEEGGAP